MLLLFPCPGTISAPNCQMSCCTPPSSGCAAAASSRLSTAATMASTLSCGVDPAPSPSGLGRGTRLSPSAASRPARKRPSDLAVRYAAAAPCKHLGGPAATKRVLFSDLLVSSPSSSQAPPNDSPGTIFPVANRFFTCPGPVVPSQPPQQRYPDHQRSRRLDL
jgi:hypothetical protein